MCSYSAVIDTWRQDWQPYIQPPISPFAPYPNKPRVWPGDEELDHEKLKKEIAEFQRILKKAREWDKLHLSEPCVETPQKIEALMEIVRALGLEEEVEIVLKETEENDDNADTPTGGSTPTTIRDAIRGGVGSGTYSVDGSTAT